MKILLYGSLLLTLPALAQNNNGLLDQLEELGIRDTVWIPAAGGTRLATDVYLPITGDSLALNFNVLGQQIYAQIIPKGIQLVVYPTMLDANGQEVPNPNPYQLPMLLSRTPYGKQGLAAAGNAIPLLGYAFVNQDVRGRFESEGTYLPMFSDGWAKAPYMNESMSIDLTATSDPANGIYHEDGWATLQYLLNDYQRDYDLDGDGIPETTATVCNGTMGTVGASAFAIPHFQLSAAHRLDTLGRGLRSMFAAIATGEHYSHTAYHNGIFREQLVNEWLDGQLNDLDESGIADGDLQNNLHTPGDYGFLTNQSVIEETLDFLTEYKYTGSTVSNAYPNSPGRICLDISHAPVDANGEADPNGAFSRYMNLDVPTYHITGWWDIFTSGQLETWQQTRLALQGTNRRLQKMVIGPWAHVTLSMQTTGDMTYPANVADVLGIAADGLDFSNILNLDLSQLIQSELIRWFRYTMNERGYVRLGEPMIRIPESQQWQDVGAFDLRIPSENYDLTLYDFLNFLTGQGSLPDMPIEIDFGIGGPIQQDITIPSVGGILPIPGDPIQPPAVTDFSQVPNVRLYVVGPNDSLPENAGVGNYWMAADEFPLPASEVTYVPMYLHANGMLDDLAPTQDEGLRTYAHDPNNPVLTVGGGNLFNESPDGRDSHGQMDLTDSLVVNLTLNRPDVLHFETALLSDTVCVIGIPKATIYASSAPQGGQVGETDTDFMIRLVDVYPDGRQFYVTEGVVNARAREYVRSLYNGQEDVNAPFSNIQNGQVYELQFPMQAIAYTFGKNHRIKVLVSSSNHPRYQANPNVPIMPGEFFRRKPNDGQTYTFRGMPFTARIADNSVYFAPQQASRIELPLYHYVNTGITTVADETPLMDIQAFPNPTIEGVELRADWTGETTWFVFDAAGRLLLQQQTPQGMHRLSMQGWAAGSYQVQAVRGEQKAVVTVIKK